MNPRVELYFALSECYKEPSDAFARDVAEGVLYQVVTDSFQALGLSMDTSTGLSTSLKPLHIVGTPEAVLQTLKRAYYPLFVIPPRFVLPVESVYKDWAGEDGFLSGSRGMIMGPPAMDMLRRYRAQDILIPESFKDYPDHLALLLEYGGLLSEQGNAEELREFVAGHLEAWVEEFAEQIRSRTESPFYQAVAEATVAFIQTERQRLEITVP